MDLSLPLREHVRISGMSDLGFFVFFFFGGGGESILKKILEPRSDEKDF